jgi:septal ring factor EnvC (AmiA/AmiB activator)
MEAKTFSVDELNQIKSLQEKYNSIGMQLVQVKLSLKKTEETLKALKNQEAELESQIVETNNKEKELAKQLDTKYGAGTLDLESGIFTPSVV